MIEKSSGFCPCAKIRGGAPRGTPCAGGRVVQLRSQIASIRAVKATSRDEYLAVGQQGRWHIRAGCVEIAGVAPTRSRLCRGESCWA